MPAKYINHKTFHQQYLKQNYLTRPALTMYQKLFNKAPYQSTLYLCRAYIFASSLPASLGIQKNQKSVAFMKFLY